MSASAMVQGGSCDDGGDDMSAAADAEAVVDVGH